MSIPTVGNSALAKRTPVTVLATIVTLVIIAASFVIGVLAIGGVNASSTPLITAVLAIIGPTVPALLALYKAEGTQTDIRNGVLVDKVKEGTTQAIAETAVLTENSPRVVTNDSATQIAIQALTKLLEQNATATVANTAATQTNTDAVQTARTSNTQGEEK